MQWFMPESRQTFADRIRVEIYRLRYRLLAIQLRMHPILGRYIRYI